MSQKLYNSYTQYIKSTFSERVQKISIDAGFTCPNRDGKKARGGCTYCNNDSFSPFYCSSSKSIYQQLNEGIDFFYKKYPNQHYLAYFQSYSNTYDSLHVLKKKYEEALSHPKVIGLVIGTRPDCVDEKLMEYLSKLSEKYYLVLEFGIESTLDSTLERINRAHNYKETIDAFELAKKYGIKTGGHIILGLPGESHEQMLEHAKKIAELPLNFLKLHQLQILRGTKMASDYMENKSDYKLFNLDEYVEFVAHFMSYLKEDIVLERFTSEAPESLLIAPQWGGFKNFQIVHLIENEMKKKELYQGKFLT